MPDFAPRHRARKRFGQHFLTDPAVIHRIIATLAPQAGDALVEIGPGTGALTAPVIAQGHHLIAIEIDRDLAAQLRHRYPEKDLTLINVDVLHFDFCALSRTMGQRLRVVGNLPYNISSPILFYLAQAAHAISDIQVMLQKEVAQRLIAPPGSSAYGRLSVMLQYHFHIECLFSVPPDAFDPPPQVDSAIVRLIPRSAPQRSLVNEDALSLVVSTAFAQRRKTLRNTLRSLFDDKALLRLGLDPNTRAQTLSLAQYIKLADALALRQEGQTHQPGTKVAITGA
jgi:16S rRNA (adenine1518-N6/adenine1519-N6)-dimethyltransferase